MTRQRKRIKVPVRVADEEQLQEQAVEQTVQDESSAEAPAPERESGPEVVPETEEEAGPEELADYETLVEEVKRLREELEQARAETAMYKDRYLRTAAEMENLRKRLEKRYAEQAEQEKRRFLRHILPLVDNLEMVLKHSESDPAVLRQGVEMIVQELLRTLEMEGVKPIKSVGERFDPFMHEAVEAVESTEHPAETVIDEVQRGYTYKGELLRPARVRVSRNEG